MPALTRFPSMSKQKSDASYVAEVVNRLRHVGDDAPKAVQVRVWLASPVFYWGIRLACMQLLCRHSNKLASMHVCLFACLTAYVSPACLPAVV